MGSEVTPRPEPELTCDCELCIAERDCHGIGYRASDSVGETPAGRRISAADRAEQILRALTLLL
jgi:hypothetical protein